MAESRAENDHRASLCLALALEKHKQQGSLHTASIRKLADTLIYSRLSLKKANCVESMASSESSDVVFHFVKLDNVTLCVSLCSWKSRSWSAQRVPILPNIAQHAFGRALLLFRFLVPLHQRHAPENWRTTSVHFGTLLSHTERSQQAVFLLW